MSIGDVVMVFEGTYAQYLSLHVPGWVDEYPAVEVRAHDLRGTPLAGLAQVLEPGREPPGRACLRDRRVREQSLRRTAELLATRGFHRLGQVRRLMNVRPLRVAVLITRLEGGAGVLALRGAKALDPDDFQVTIITGSGNHLLDQAAAAGLEVISRASVAHRLSIHAAICERCAHSSALLRRGRFDVVAHAHREGGDARPPGRQPRLGAANRPYLPRLPVPRVPVPRPSRCVRRDRTPTGPHHGRRVVRRDRSGRRGRPARPDRARTGSGPSGWPSTAQLGAEPSGPRAGGREPRAARARACPPTPRWWARSAGSRTRRRPRISWPPCASLGRPGVIGVWVGGGELAARVSRLASMQPAAPVVLAGERADVPEILPAFDVFALPSRYEGLPTAVVEAMVCGIPVVATAVNAVSDVVVPGETGLLVPPQRPDLLADAVRYLLDRPAVAARMADHRPGQARRPVRGASAARRAESGLRGPRPGH